MNGPATRLELLRMAGWAREPTLSCGGDGSAQIFSVTGSSGTTPKPEREPGPQDRERRIELLRLYAGDLDRARKAERWIVWGDLTETPSERAIAEGTEHPPQDAPPPMEPRSPAPWSSDSTEPEEPARKDGLAGERGPVCIIEDSPGLCPSTCAKEGVCLHRDSELPEIPAFLRRAPA